MLYRIERHTAKKTITCMLITCLECEDYFWWNNPETPEFCPLCGIPYGEKKPIDYPKKVREILTIPKGKGGKLVKDVESEDDKFLRYNAARKSLKETEKKCR